MAQKSKKGGAMKTMYAVVLALVLFSIAVQADVKIVTVKGEVAVRRGAEEVWLPAKAGDLLKPEDSMRSGKNASATISVDGVKELSLPEMVIIDISDIRVLTQEELLLKLAMEGIRSIPSNNNKEDITIPKTTTIHGSDKGVRSKGSTMNKESFLLLLNGTKVLYRHGFYATSVLRAKEVFRLDPSLQKRIDVRLMVADAFEKVQLSGEALTEYVSLSKEKLSANERKIVENKIAELKKTQKG